MKEGCRPERQEEKTPPPEKAEKKEESRAGIKTGPGKQTYNSGSMPCPLSQGVGRNTVPSSS